jgi:hypothetical protein
MKKEKAQKKENRGGARPNCGRKPIEDKKFPVTVFIQESKIKKHGGKEKLKTKLIEFIN